MAKTRRHSLSNQAGRLTLTLWVIGIVAVLLLVVQHFIYDQNNAILRLLIVLAAIGVPIIILLWQFNRQVIDIIDLEFDPVLIILSGGLGLAVWAIGWWGMAVLQEDILFEIFGAFVQPSIYLPNNLDDRWVWLVLGDVVLIPMGLMLLLWGELRQQVQDAPMWQVALLCGGYLGLMGSLLFGQGISGILGYGLCGVAASFVSIYARTAWAGFATHATFMYANHAFLDDLLREMTFQDENGTRLPEPYFGIQWLSLVLIAVLLSIALVQIIRFRSSLKPSETPSAKISLTSSQWRAVGLAAIVFVFLIVDEAQRRL